MQILIVIRKADYLNCFPYITDDTDGRDLQNIDVKVTK